MEFWILLFSERRLSAHFACVIWEYVHETFPTRQTAVLSKLLAPHSCDLIPLSTCFRVLSNAVCTKQRFRNYKITFIMQMTVMTAILQVVRETALLNGRY